MGKFAIEIKWGIIFTIVSLLWMVIEKTAGWHGEHIAQQVIYTNIFAFPAILIYVLALREKKSKFYTGTITWTQAFISGVVLSVVITVFSPLVQYITFTAISPDFFDNAIQNAVSHNITPEKAKAYFNMNSYVLQGISGGLSMGILTSAIVALFIRTKNIQK